MTEFDLGRILPIDKGEWNDTYSTEAGPGYEKLDKVTAGYGSYLSLVANNTAPLTDRASWFPYVDGASIDGRVTQVESDISQLAGDVNELGIKDAVQGAKIKDIENVLSTANLGQSTQVSVSGRKVVSLPKNASNGGMQVKLEGLTTENLINGKGDNLNGWNNVVQLEIVDGWFRLVNDAVRPSGLYQTNLSTGDKIYIYFEYFSTGAPIRYTYGLGLLVDGSISASSVITPHVAGATAETWMSGIVLAPEGANGIGFTWAGGGQTKTGDIFFRRIKVINLTATFGAGNEPDLATCDAMFSSYFEGKKNFIPTGRVRSVDKNGLNPTELYLTAPELRSNGLVKDEIRKGANGYELVKRISDIDGTVLATPVITPISYGGILNSAENGTVYHEPVIADAGVYGTNMPILLTDYPISALEEIIKHENGVDTYLDVSTAVIAGDKLSFTHPDLASGDLVLFTYAFDKESTNGNITATFYDSNVVKIDTVTGKAYKITDVVTNGVLTRTLTEV